MTSRPCAVLSSMRSASILETIAVELIASAPPSVNPCSQAKPSKCSPTIAMTVVIATCANPRPNTARRIAFNCGRLNSSPMENIRKTMPNSAKSRTSLLSGTQPSACGPTAMPITT